MTGSEIPDVRSHVACATETCERSARPVLGTPDDRMPVVHARSAAA
jgi:hypothetical protein